MNCVAADLSRMPFRVARGDGTDYFALFNELSADGIRPGNPHTRTGSDVPPDIIDSLNNGDHKAFEYIYLRYFDSLSGFLVLLMRSREEAEEIAQEVFASLWTKRGIFSPEKGIKRYLFQLCKFHAFNYFDRIKVHEKYKEFQSRNYNFGVSPDDVIEADETALLIELAITRMPPRQRQVFLLNREQNLSYEEIAARIGISRNKVRNYISASLRELREILSASVFTFM